MPVMNQPTSRISQEPTDIAFVRAQHRRTISDRPIGSTVSFSGFRQEKPTGRPCCS